MCKIVIYARAPFADQPKKQRPLFDKLLEALGKTEHDGLGLAWTDHTGTVHHRKWATSSDCRGLLRDDMRSKVCVVGSTPVDDMPASGFAMLHGRTATSEKGLLNAHPHVADDGSTTFALIHNGVVSMSEANKQELGELVSKCDSELILAAFMKGGMEHVSKTVCGYYAFGVIVSSGREDQYLHVVRDDRATLYAGELADGSMVFATTQELMEMAGAVKQGRMVDLAHLVFGCDGKLMEMFDIPRPCAYVYTPCIPTVTPGSGVIRDFTPRVMTPEHYERVWEKYRDRHERSEQNDPVEKRVAVQEEMNELLDATLEQLDQKIAKSKARTERLETARARRQDDIVLENKRVIASQATGTSAINSVPLSDDEAQAAAAALIEAERHAACVTGPSDDDCLPGELTEGQIAAHSI